MTDPIEDGFMAETQKPGAGKFKPGQTVMTRGFIALFGDLDNTETVAIASIASARLLKRHLAGDWGDLDEEDKAANNRGLKPGQEDRLMSVYHVTVLGKSHKVWVITEHDRSSTCVLLPSEY